MDMLLVALTVAVVLWHLKRQDQRQRMALLGSHLSRFQIEKHMETLHQGYMRALGEEDAGRREQIWQLMQSTEQALAQQFIRFAADFSLVNEAQTRVSRLPFYFPWVTRFIPAATFDMRKALAVHANGIGKAVGADPATAPKARAYTISAELFLMQHTCHWFCKSRLVATAPLAARHQTGYAQTLAAVGAETLSLYLTLVGSPPR